MAAAALWCRPDSHSSTLTFNHMGFGFGFDFDFKSRFVPHGSLSVSVKSVMSEFGQCESQNRSEL